MNEFDIVNIINIIEITYTKTKFKIIKIWLKDIIRRTNV